MEKKLNKKTPIYYVGKGYWNDDNWVDINGNKVGIPTSDSEVIVDERCTMLKIGYKPFFNIFVFFINSIVFYPFATWGIFLFSYRIHASKITIAGGKIKFVTPVVITRNVLVVHEKGVLEVNHYN